MTPLYGFILPALGTGSWHTAFCIVLPQQIEAAVASAEQATGARGAIVLSAYVSNTLRLGYDSGGQLAGSSVWTQLSGAPIGAFVGSFRIVASQRHAYFRFAQDFWGPSFVSTPTMNLGSYHWRCIILPGSINVAGSAWVAKWGDDGAPNDDGQRRVHFAAVTSLGPGQYQARIEHKHFIFGAQDSGWAQWPGHKTILEVWEVERG